MEHTISPKQKGRKQLFNNPILERLTKTHIAFPLTLYTLMSVGWLYYGATEKGLSGLHMVLMFGLGFLFLTLVEYLAHRYFYHMDPSTRIKKKIQYAVHGVHHEYPKDKKRLAMPPLLALVYVAFFFITIKFFLGDDVYAFGPGMLMGYTTYLFIHYAVHAYQPPKNFLKILWIHHAIHHYKDNERAYGVTSPLWDWVFGTMPR